MARIVIRNEDELNEALDRAIHLAGSAKGGDEQRELNAINAAVAVELYEQSLAVTAGSGRSERRTKDDVPSGTGSE